MEVKYRGCEYGHGECTAPETNCSHWQGTFCEFDMLNHGDESKKCFKFHCIYGNQCSFWISCSKCYCYQMCGHCDSEECEKDGGKE